MTEQTRKHGCYNREPFKSHHYVGGVVLVAEDGQAPYTHEKIERIEHVMSRDCRHTLHIRAMEKRDEACAGCRWEKPYSPHTCAACGEIHDVLTTCEDVMVSKP